jgi:hypothetical protein
MPVKATTAVCGWYPSPDSSARIVRDAGMGYGIGPSKVTRGERAGSTEGIGSSVLIVAANAGLVPDSRPFQSSPGLKS